MQNELDVLRDVSRRLESESIQFMLSGSMAMNYYAQPRMTRDIDIVVELDGGNVAKIAKLFTPDYYLSPEAIAQAVMNRSMFNVIHLESVIKVDFVIRKEEPFRRAEFERRARIQIDDFQTWIVSKEDLILSKLNWARDSLSERQINDVRNLMATGYDSEYLSSWVQRLDLEDVWQRATQHE